MEDGGWRMEDGGWRAPDVSPGVGPRVWEAGVLPTSHAETCLRVPYFGISG